MSKKNKATPLPDPIFVNGVRPARGKSFTQRLMEALEKDKKERPYAYVGMIIYPINGRAQGITPIGHYADSREEIIRCVRDEVTQQEPEFAEEGLKLLETNDVVRIGRIIVEILPYPRNIETEGAAVL